MFLLEPSPEPVCFKYDWCNAGKDMWLWDVPLYLFLAWGVVCGVYFLGWLLVLVVKADVAWARENQATAYKRVARKAVKNIDEEYEALVAGRVPGAQLDLWPIPRKPSRVERLYRFIDRWVD